MDLTQSCIFFAISMLAAAVNAVAGGGTFLTFPVFILNGLTASQANIMSSIALWPGVLSSAYGYKEQMIEGKREMLPFAIIGIIGSIIGAYWFLNTQEETFASLVPWLLLGATLIFTFGKRMLSRFRMHDMGAKQKQFFVFAMQSLTAIYGGYFGAGIGILTLAMLQILGHDHIHRMNALKTIVTASINLSTVCIFIISGEVLWAYAGIMIAGALCGGFIGARLALKTSPQLVRHIVSVIGFSMAAYFFYETYA